MTTFSQEELHSVLEYAIMAPSADNQHHIFFQVTDPTMRVWYAEKELPTEGGYKRVLALLSLGAVLENMVIAASRSGLRVKAALLPESDQPNLLLHIRFERQTIAVDPLWEVIPRRHTCREVLFRGPRMDDHEFQALDSAVRARSGTHLFWLDEPDRRRAALCLMRRAESERFHNRILHEELFSAIRFDVGWQASCADGLPPGSLGVEVPLRPFFALLRHWSVARLANGFGMHHLLGFRSSALPCRLAPHVGLLAVDTPDDQSVLDAGRAFQRLWLVATAHGRVLQPLPAAALYACRKSSALEGIPAALQEALAAGWQRLVGAAIPLMIFRAGFAGPSPVSTGRRPIADYLRPI